MDLGHAIVTAIKFESRVHAVYAEAAAAAGDAEARRAFSILRDEEMAHIRYLRRCLEEWRSTGMINEEELPNQLGSRAAIEAGVARVRDTVRGGSGIDDGGGELESLHTALAAERETENFSRQMVDRLDGDGRRLFRRFVEIEEGHVAVVRAQIELVSLTGTWIRVDDLAGDTG